MVLTRAQFNSAALEGWDKVSHKTFNHLVYFTRTTTIQSRHDVDEEEDPATATVVIDTLVCTQHIVYSPTFQVPAFYFIIHDSNGAPLLLEDILRTPFFRLNQQFEKTSFALTEPNAPFPLLSQGDHPVTGNPCWYFHPCETQKAVSELLDAMRLPESNWNEDEMVAHWMKAWMLVLGTAVSL